MVNPLNRNTIASLHEIAELVHSQVYPEGDDDPAVPLVDFIQTAKVEYAYQLWKQNREEWLLDGYNSVPANLISEIEITVTDKIADISGISAVRSLMANTWIQRLGDFDCAACLYDIMDLNQWNLLCGDDSRDKNSKAAVIVGKKIRFPEGTFSNDGKVQMFYANSGENLDEEMEVEDALGGLVRRSLWDIYSKKAPTDITNNENPNT